ncbi:hypothetical protein BCV70DRAFT_171162, partial [Testicularia cyperi]
MTVQGVSVVDSALASLSPSLSQRRKELQRQAVAPNGFRGAAPLDRAQRWLELLGVDSRALSQTGEDSAPLTRSSVSSTPARTTSESQRAAASEPLLSAAAAKIPIDKDGWQVASPELLSEEHDSLASSQHADDDGWKTVSTKRTRRATASSHQSNTATSHDGDSKQSPGKAEKPALASASSKRKRKGRKRATGADQENEDIDARSAVQDTCESLHRDHEQVDKDIQRSFVGPAFARMFSTIHSPTHDPDSEAAGHTDLKTLRRRQLSDLVLSTLGKHPSLSYFQGYHDILTVLLLTLAPELPGDAVGETDALLRSAAERLSLHLIRDSMTNDLQPIMGQLKILRNLLRACDAQMAELSERASALPFFALPWLLTLFTHDLEDIAVSQRVMDFLLAYGPASAIYLCAAVILAKKDDIVSQDPDDLEDPSMLHLLLSKLPKIASDQPDSSAEPPEQPVKGGSVDESAIYTDPDVELPSLASDRALASELSSRASTPPPSLKRKDARPGIPIHALLEKAVELMKRHPLTSDNIGADRIMGPQSTLFTWSRLFDEPPSSRASTTADMIAPSSTDNGSSTNTVVSNSVDWTQQNDAAASILRGPVSAIVKDPHPDPPSMDDDDAFATIDEKQPGPFRGKLRRSAASSQTAVLAVVGISGLLVAALYAQSGNLAAFGGGAGGLTRSFSSASSSSTTAEAKQVLTLIVSLLSQWGRVV